MGIFIFAGDVIVTFRKIAIMIDGGFLLKRLPNLTGIKAGNLSAQDISKIIRFICKRHVVRLTDCDEKKWHRHVYRIFYYDAVPYDGKSHDPIKNAPIDFGKSEEAKFRRELFNELRSSRKVALRLGKVVKDGDWSPPTNKIKKILPTKSLFENINIEEQEGSATIELTKEQLEIFRSQKRRWSEIGNHEIKLGLRQKGVDMRIGLDISSISLKKQSETIILIAGDSDFVPAAKLARREGVEFILDPMQQPINEDLFEHIDGLYNGFNWSHQNFKKLLLKTDEEDD